MIGWARNRYGQASPKGGRSPNDLVVVVGRDWGPATFHFAVRRRLMLRDNKVDVWQSKLDLFGRVLAYPRWGGPTMWGLPLRLDGRCWGVALGAAFPATILTGWPRADLATKVRGFRGPDRIGSVGGKLEEPSIQDLEAAYPDDSDAKQLGDEHYCASDQRCPTDDHVLGEVGEHRGHR